MIPSSAIDSHIIRLRKRVRLLLAERYGLFGACGGAVAAAVLVLLSYRFDELVNYWLWLGAIVLGAAAGVAYALLRKLNDLAVALAADKRTGLKERLSTAVVFRKIDEVGSMESALISDASTQAEKFKAKEVFRHKFGVPHIAFAACLILFLAVVFIPMLPKFQSPQKRAEIEVMKKEGTKLVSIAKGMKKETDPKRANLRKLAGKLQKLGMKMETGRMAKKQAMIKTQRLSKEIKQEQDRLAKENSKAKSMEQAQAEMRKASQELAKKMAAEMAKKENIPPQEAMQKLPSDKRLAELARKEGPLTESERKELEQAVQKYADPNNKSAIPSELGEALAKLAQNKDFQKASQLMQKLAQKMNSGKMGKADQKALQQQMQMLAKALKKTDLDKLAKQMLANANKLAKMSPQELEKLIKQAQEMQKMAKMLAKAGAG